MLQSSSNANAFGGTFAVFPNAQSQTKNSKRATKPTYQDRHEMTTNNHDRKEGRSANSGFKKLAVLWLNEVQFFNQTFVLADSFVLRNRQLLKPANRYLPPPNDTRNDVYL
jgi:hypothetical protein